AELWADGLQIAKVLLRRKAPLDPSQTRVLWLQSGNFESRLGQHQNAIGSYRKALATGNHDTHRLLIAAMHSAKRPPQEIEKEVRRYLAAFPERADRFDLLAQVGNAFANANDLPRARQVALEVMRAAVGSGDLPRAYVAWCGDDHRQAEQGLRQAIAGNPEGAATLRAVLALDLFRDRLKDSGKARAQAREYLRKRPSEDAWAEPVIAYLLSSSPDEKAFRSDLALVVESARNHPHLRGFQERAWKWNGKDKQRNNAYQQARKQFTNEEAPRLWKQVWERGGKAGQACQELLKQNPTTEQKHILLSRLAYNYRHHFGGNARKNAAGHYQAFCKAFPKDFAAAEAWLEAAAYAEDPKEARLAAARHLLGFAPRAAHHDTWLRLIETRDPVLIRKALPWITKSSAQSANQLTHSTRIGDLLSEIEMKPEALAW
ncbi:MAG: hypothetical protein GWO24_24835, partial [Akkermansiaceae bacterium]|nr:hypothetical protein [Akkermansiaceae bacterium]NIV21195.1 hypothetical protein [Gammaproteobacteria bacterium]